MDAFALLGYIIALAAITHSYMTSSEVDGLRDRLNRTANALREMGYTGRL